VDIRGSKEQLMRSSILAGYLSLLFTASCAVSDDGAPSELPEEVPASEAAPTDKGPVFANNNCSNVEIKVTNWRDHGDGPTAILVHRVEYYSQGDWHTEDLSNESIDYGHFVQWNNEDLPGTDGDVITKFRVYYNYLLTPFVWSGLVYQEINTPDETCVDDANFEMTVL
jgi:hypothetical protein